MKKILLLLFVSVLGIGLNQSCAQESNKKESSEKNLWVEEKDGNLTVIVTEKEGDKVTKEVLTGEEAEKYLVEQEDKNVMFLSEDGDHEKVIVMEMKDGEEGSYTWVSDMDMDFDFEFGEMEKELEALRDELDDLSKDEIAERLDELIELKEEAHQMKVIHMEEIHDDMERVHAISGDMDITVEEVDGVMTITKTVGDTKEVEEIIIDGDNNKKVVVVKSMSGDGHKEIESVKMGSMDNLNMNVYPNPNNGNFTIELDLKSDEEANVKVLDSSGKEVYSRTVKGVEKHKLDVKLKKPSAGLYVIIVEQGNSTLKMKTIVE